MLTFSFFSEMLLLLLFFFSSFENFLRRSIFFWDRQSHGPVDFVGLSPQPNIMNVQRTFLFSSSTLLLSLWAKTRTYKPILQNMIFFFFKFWSRDWFPKMKIGRAYVGRHFETVIFLKIWFCWFIIFMVKNNWQRSIFIVLRFTLYVLVSGERNNSTKAEKGSNKRIRLIRSISN